MQTGQPKLVSVRFALLGALLSAPVFLEKTRSAVQLAPGRTAATEDVGTIIPISVIILAVVVPGLALRRLNAGFRLKAQDILVIAYFIILTISLGAGAIVHAFDFKGMATCYAQSVFPLTAFALARLLGTETITEKRQHLVGLRRGHSVLLGMAACAILFLGLYLLQTLLEGGSAFRWGYIADHIGPLYNHQMTRFYPTLLAGTAVLMCSRAISPVHTVQARYLAFVLTAGCVFSIAMMHCRAALLTAVLGCGLVFFAELGPRFVLNRKLVPMFGVAVITALIGLFALTQMETMSFARLTASVPTLLSQDTQAMAEGDANRVAAMSTGLRVGFSTPLGGMFKLEEQRRGMRVINAECGYLDIAVRGGPFAAAVVIWLLGLTVWKGSFAAVRVHSNPAIQERVWFFRGVVICVAGYALCNLVMNALTEPYLGVFVWYLVGWCGSLEEFSGTDENVRVATWSSPDHFAVPS